ncbi:hypothetical protein SAMN06265346_101131 [Flavobacterium hercynium]|nr:hypothetical protein SAMN06265346_101131 [Flavobacterium hercynium]
MDRKSFVAFTKFFYFSIRINSYTNYSTEIINSSLSIDYYF